MKILKWVSRSLAILTAVFGLAGSSVALAAPVISLGNAETYSVLSGSSITNSGATTISGNAGLYPAGSATGFGTVTFGGGSSLHNGDVSAQNAQFDQKAVFDTDIAAPAKPCTAGFTAMAPSLNGLVLDPGVYCTPVDFTLSGTLTLRGTGSPATDVWIFRSERDLIVSGGAAAKVVFTGTGGNACNVWWRIARTATFDGANTMVGNILAATSITFGTDAVLDGRAFAYTAEVTMLGNTISGPTCAAAPATITVVKSVINVGGGTKSIADFPLFVSGTLVTSSASNVFAPGTYTVTETTDSHYTRAYSGDCNVSTGNITLTPGDNLTCYITNTYIVPPVPAQAAPGSSYFVAPVPPLIDIVKVPDPLALPMGPGAVVYTYTVKNIGTVPMTDVTLAGDTCSPIVLTSGDTNGDSKLDLTETWVYHCSTTLAVTHTNTVVATGWANGLSATDVANATVVVGLPVVPPLIHVTKVPSPLTLPAGGGLVTYTERITNPGTVALSNVQLNDDKCAPMKYISGDTNGDSKLQNTEGWVYTCRTRLTQTTLNTAVATGEANGLTVRDFAVATVVVAPVLPTMPHTGYTPTDNTMPWAVMIISGGFMLMAGLLAFVLKKHSI